MIWEILAVLVGLGLTIWAADRFVEGASAGAAHLGIRPLTIGLTVVALGTSAPEIFTAGAAAVRDQADLGIGNAIGSNIANIGLILGITALVVPMQLSSATLRRELPLLTLITLLVVLLIMPGQLGAPQALGLLALLAISFLWIVYIARAPNRQDPLVSAYAEQLPEGMSGIKAAFWTGAGLVLLLAAAHLLVWGAAGIAEGLGISDLLIGLTVIAFGTSLPELATCIAAVLKRRPDLAVGNILGSNLFNLVAVLPLPALLAPGAVSPDLLKRDLPVMLGFTLLVVILARGFRRPGRINRPEGALLLVLFLAYLVLLGSGIAGRPPA